MRRIAAIASDAATVKDLAKGVLRKFILPAVLAVLGGAALGPTVQKAAAAAAKELSAEPASPTTP